QPKSKKTNPTGNLRLSQTDSDFEHKSYFYETFFGGLPWSPTPGKETEQEVIVVFHCWIDGSDYGFQEIRISHDPRRVAEQGNVPTVLHWGPLSPILKNTNYIGHFVTLEQMKDRTFNLFISEKPRGEYLAYDLRNTRMILLSESWTKLGAVAKLGQQEERREIITAMGIFSGRHFPVTSFCGRCAGHCRYGVS